LSETEFKLQRLSDGVGILTIWNEGDHTKPTTLGRHALESLAAALDELEAQEWRALLVTGKPFIFCAGADIAEFPRATSAEIAAAGSRAGHDQLARLRALPFQTVAAINGVCLGGGVEVALHCDARTIASSVRHFAAPEVALGIIPGWGGTQLVPRLVGAKGAIDFIVMNPLRQNRMLDARKALDLGFADRILDPVEFVDESLAWTRELAEQGGFAREDADLSDMGEVIRRARSQLDDQVHGAAPAPYAALDLIEGAAGWTVEEGYRAEERASGRLLPGHAAQASVYGFGLIEFRAKKQPGIPKVEPRKIRKVGIVGAGLMATQLATLFLKRLEVPIVLRDLEQATVDRALEEIRSQQKGPRSEFLGSIVTGTTGWDEFAGCDLVLEAVFEELSVKKDVFAALERVVSPECILATNTSSLSVTEMGADLEHPERVVGLHFFNPVAVLPLVELVATPETDDATLATAAALTGRLRKRAVRVEDAPAFVVNRVLTRMSTVLMDALEHGNTTEETDEAVLRLGMPMAPSVLLQMVGPRVSNHVLHTLNAAFPDRFPTFATLDNYAEGKDEIVVREHAPRPVEELTAAVLDAVADEIGHMLDERVVAEAADVDTCLILGAGWPLWLGGITKHLDQTGVSQRVVGMPLAEAGATASV
jgi:3-hydroxyacyl-CoA dehydrogenase/enoyl-CoA hydratase/carnithine racemase